MNCPVTTEDVDNAEKIFGPDIGTMKGKTTRRNPTPVKKDEVQIPKELIEKNQDITLCIDLLFVNGMPMLTSIDRAVRFRALIPIESRKKEELFTGLDVILRQYNKAGFQITTINCDQEFESMMNKIKDDLGVDINPASQGEHVPEAERNNRAIKERIRSTYHNQPHNKLPSTFAAPKTFGMKSYVPRQGLVLPARRRHRRCGRYRRYVPSPRCLDSCGVLSSRSCA